MSATMMKIKKATVEWSSIFPNAQANCERSCMFMKKLLAIAVSNITYLRSIFPEHVYGDRCVEDLNLKILKDNPNCPGSCQVIKWMKGCFDALEKNYLRMVVIGIYLDEDNPDNVIESYTFKFSYTEGGGVNIYRNNENIANAVGPDDTKKSTIRLLRTILVLTQTLKSLPDDVLMTMKLAYYDDVTPADYEPPGFKAAPTVGFQFEDEPTSITVGEVITPFHSVKVRIKTARSQIEAEDSDEAIVPESNAVIVVEDDKEIIDQLDVESPQIETNVPSDIYGLDPVSITPALPTGNAVVPGSNDNAFVSQTSVGEEPPVVHCSCDHSEDDGIMILCHICNTWQHGVCYKILTEDQAPATHICYVCATSNKEYAKQATDPSLADLSEIDVQGMCLWRRALHACLENELIVAATFSDRLSVEVTVAQGLINRMSKERFVQGRKNKHGIVVNHQRIRNQGFQKYFSRDNVDEDNKENIPEMDDKEMDNPTNTTEKLAILKGKGRKTDVKTETSHRGQKRVHGKTTNIMVNEDGDKGNHNVGEDGDATASKKKSSVAHKSLLV